MRNLLPITYVIACENKTWSWFVFVMLDSYRISGATKVTSIFFLPRRQLCWDCRVAPHKKKPAKTAQKMEADWSTLNREELRLFRRGREDFYVRLARAREILRDLGNSFSFPINSRTPTSDNQITVYIHRLWLRARLTLVLINKSLFP